MPINYTSGVKKPGLTTNYTPEQVKEIIRCGQDPIYFAEKYYYIVHPTEGKMLIDLYDYQKELIETFKDNQKTVVLAARQVGKTTCSALFLLWYALFNEDKLVAILANKQKTAKSIVDEIKIAYENLPMWMKPGVTEYNNLTVRFENGTEIQAAATSPDALRGESVSLLFLDEFAFIPENMAEDFWRSNYPTLSCVTKDTMLLTDNGLVEIGEYIDTSKPKGCQYEIDGLNVWGKNGIEKASHFYNSPKTEIKKIGTQYGLGLATTFDHPVYAINDHKMGMVKSKDINIGDYVRVDYGMDVYGNEVNINYLDGGTYKNNHDYYLQCDKLDVDLCYLLGVYIAEGWFSQDCVIISNTDHECRQMFLKSKFQFREISESRLMSDKATGRLFKYLLGGCWNKKCYEKTVPKCILRTTKKNQQSFIAGYLDGDGHVTKKGDISASSTSKKLITVIQQMLLNMGIISNIHEVDVRDEQIGKYVLPQGTLLQSLRVSWSLRISRNYGNILHDFGWHISRKKLRLCDNIKESAKNKQIKIPAFDWVVDSIRQALSRTGKNAHQCRKNGCRIDKVLSGKDSHITRSNFVKLSVFLQDATFDYMFKDFLENKCFFDKVVSFDYYEEDTYDLTCPTTSTFLQNGILGSNTGGNVIIVSTPNGAAGKFYDLYTKAENNQNDFTPVKVAWDAHPDRDEAWKEATIKEFGLQAFLQEYQLSFTGSTRTLIEGEVLTSLVYQEPPENGILEDGKYKIWVPPRKNHIYAMGTDTGQGVGGDYSVINIFDITTYQITGRIEQVAVWADNQTRVFDFAEIILRVAEEWFNPYIIVEANQNFGAIVTKLLYFENGYENMFYDTAKGEFGVFASGTTKSLALTHFKDQVESGTMVLKSEEMIKELSYFEEVKDGVFKARKGKNFHDDFVTSGYWVSYMLKDKWFEDAYDTMRAERGIATISDKSQQELTDEGTLDLFMSSFGSGDDFEQSMFDREMWLDEPEEAPSHRQIQLQQARQEHYEKHRQEALAQKRRLDRHNR